MGTSATASSEPLENAVWNGVARLVAWIIGRTWSEAAILFELQSLTLPARPTSRNIAMAAHRFLIAALLLTGLNGSIHGKPIADFTLADSAGKAWKLHEQKTKATVIVFLATECPMSNGYLPALAELAKKHADKGVAVVGIYPHPETTAAQLAAHAKEYQLTFPLLRDPDHAAVTALGAKATPEAFVLDDKFAVRYRGRI